MRYLIAIILLLATATAYAATGERPNAATNIGSLWSNDSIVVDRVNTSGKYKTTPDDIKNYVYNSINGSVAPAQHTHPAPFATYSGAGLMQAYQVRAVDSMPITTRREGAIADGSWHSLASQGFLTVAAARARWPYLTSDGTLLGIHYVQSEADLSALGIDWTATQSACNQGVTLLRPVVISASSGAHIFERGVVAPSGAPLVIYGEYASANTDSGSTIRPDQSVMATTIPLITAAPSTPIEVSRVRFAANRVNSWPQYAAIKAPTALNPTIRECFFEGINRGLWVTAPSWGIDARNNKQSNSGDLVYGDVSAAGGASNYHGFVRVWDNEAKYPTLEPGSGYFLRFANGVAPAATLIVKRNSGWQVNGIVHINDTTSTVAGNFGDISDNEGILNKNTGGSAGTGSPIYAVCAMYYEIKVQHNRVYEGQGNSGRIVLGGQDQMLVTDNEAQHSNGPMLHLMALPTSLLFSDNLSANGTALSLKSQISVANTLIGPVYYGFSSKSTVSLTLGANNKHARGQILPDAIGDTSRINILTAPPVTVVDVVSPLQPGMDVSEVVQLSSDLVLWNSGSTMAYKTMRVWNRRSNQATLQVTNPGGSLKDKNGNTVSALPVPYGTYIDIVHNSYVWSQI